MNNLNFKMKTISSVPQLVTLSTKSKSILWGAKVPLKLILLGSISDLNHE